MTRGECRACCKFRLERASVSCWRMVRGPACHPFMAGVADGLAERGIATMRYQFPYMEQGSKRPDAPKLAQATVRAAVNQASHLYLSLLLLLAANRLAAA
jgi:hypothetical protein